MKEVRGGAAPAEVLQVFGREYCPDFYACFLSRSAAIAAAPPLPPRTVRSVRNHRGRSTRETEGRGIYLWSDRRW